MRRWCVAWDGSPFCISIDSRHFTRWGARWRCCVRHLLGSSRTFVTTIDEALRLDAAVVARTRTMELPLIDSRFDLEEEVA